VICIYLACLILITYIGGQERLYCTHKVLIVAYDDPSPFCQASGLILLSMHMHECSVFGMILNSKNHYLHEENVGKMYIMWEIKKCHDYDHYSYCL